MERKKGMELELIVLNEDFTESNEADTLISHAKQQNVRVVQECSHAMVEINSLPGTLLEATDDLISQLSSLNDVAHTLGLRVLPLEMPLNHQFTPLLRDSPRYNAKRELLGEERFAISGKVFGSHAHFDLPDRDAHKLAHINFLKAVDPLAIALTASSPHHHEGLDYSSWRSHSYRYVVHESLPFQGQLQSFPSTYESYVEDHKNKFIELVQLTQKKNIDFTSVADAYNSIWGPTRTNPVIRTSELRSAGSVPDIGILIGLYALVDEGLNRLESAESDNLYLNALFSDSVNLEESYLLLQGLSDDAMKYGLRSDSVYNYIKSIYDFCTEHMDEQKKRIIQPVQTMISTRQNYSDKIAALQPTRTTPELYRSLYQEYTNSLQQLKGFTVSEVLQ